MQSSGKMNLGLMAYSLIRCCSTIHERGIARDWLSLVYLVQGRLWLQMDLPVSCKRLHACMVSFNFDVVGSLDNNVGVSAAMHV